MPRTRSNRQQNRRFDALIALPLARYRVAIAALSAEELFALKRRIELKIVEQRWALGSHGMARHRAPGELALLDRRREATRDAMAARPATFASQLRLVEPAPVVPLRDNDNELTEAA